MSDEEKAADRLILAFVVVSVIMLALPVIAVITLTVGSI